MFLKNKFFLCVFFCFFLEDSFSLNGKKLYIVGSTSLYPFSSTVAEYFNIFSFFSSPIVENVGTGAGFNLFCKSYSSSAPSIVNASRKMNFNEKLFCFSNDITPIEFFIGHNSFIISGSKKKIPLDLKSAHIFQALSKYILFNGSLVKNPYNFWDEIDSSLPKRPIKFLGPPLTSGIYDIFVDLAIKPFCKRTDLLFFNNFCGLLRSDGLYKTTSEDGNVIVQKMLVNTDLVGVLSYSFFDVNRKFLWAASINGIRPTIMSISDGTYPFVHSLYLYLKKEHVGLIPGVITFMTLFLDDCISGPVSLLNKKGFLPISLTLRNLQKKYLLLNLL